MFYLSTFEGAQPLATLQKAAACLMRKPRVLFLSTGAYMASQADLQRVEAHA